MIFGSVYDLLYAACIRYASWQIFRLDLLARGVSGIGFSYCIMIDDVVLVYLRIEQWAHDDVYCWKEVWNKSTAKGEALLHVWFRGLAGRCLDTKSSLLALPLPLTGLVVSLVL